jgi:hypothetical protein
MMTRVLTVLAARFPWLARALDPLADWIERYTRNTDHNGDE